MKHHSYFLEKPQLKTKRKKKNQEPEFLPINIKFVKPLTETQAQVFEEYNNDYHLFLYGTAGTGKSFIASYLAIRDVLDTDTEFDKLIIVRSAVPTRDVGFLPGNMREKAAGYEEPYIKIFKELSSDPNLYDQLKEMNKIEFVTTSNLRGLTFKNSIILFDEFQSTTYHEFSTVMTRIGKFCKVIVCGDLNQNDLERYKSQAHKSYSIMKNVSEVSFVQFGIADIVRSKFVKEFLIAEEEYVQRELPKS